MAERAAADALGEHLELAGRMGELLPSVRDTAGRLIAAFDAGGRLYAFGNGGSAADAQHLAAELAGRYRRARRPLPATSLAADPSVVTCIANDFSFEDVFARQVQALARQGDVAVGFTTSGRSENVIRGLRAAREAGATAILFGGDGPAVEDADVAIVVPSTTTARIQEMHLLLVHLVVEQVDDWAAGEA